MTTGGAAAAAPTTRHRWVVYATFDPRGTRASYVEEQLEAYREAGFDNVVVDSSPEIAHERASAWDRLATFWVSRQNVGYDFASYRHGLGLLLARVRVDPGHLDLVLTNDSCFGPFVPLASVFESFDRMSGVPKAVFGITDSEERTPHLQSYWLYVRGEAARDVMAFLDTMPTARNRDDAISHGELALAGFLADKGYRAIALNPILDVIARFATFRPWPLALTELAVRRWLDRPKYSRKADTACLKLLLRRPAPARDLNPTLAFGVDMAALRMSPFVKRSLLRDNPYGDPRLPRDAFDPSLGNADVAAMLELARR